MLLHIVDLLHVINENIILFSFVRLSLLLYCFLRFPVSVSQYLNVCTTHFLNELIMAQTVGIIKDLTMNIMKFTTYKLTKRTCHIVDA